jgi:hypothetical protein
MATFPVLSSGAVIQYPAQVWAGQAVQVTTFLDSRDQQHLRQGKSFRRWLINLEQLTDVEVAAIEMFFSDQQGTLGIFVFPDPVSGAPVPNCRMGSSTLAVEYQSTNINSTAIWVVETNG